VTSLLQTDTSKFKERITGIKVGSKAILNITVKDIFWSFILQLVTFINYNQYDTALAWEQAALFCHI
jgi:hypothetical protein